MGIKDLINSAIDSIKEDKIPNPLDSLALSLFLGGENLDFVNGLDDGVKNKINNTALFSNYRNKLTILSPKGENFIIGEILPIEIIKRNGSVNKGKVLTNIELLCLKNTPKIEGNTPIEVLLGLEKELIIQILRENKTVIKKEPIRVNNKDNLIIGVDERTRVPESEVIFYFNDAAVIVYKVDGELEVKYVPNLQTNVDEIIDTTLDVIDTFFM